VELPAAGEILDACAAPGGKSIAVALRMGPNCTLQANELSRERRQRLSANLDASLAADIRERVKVSGFDAAALGARKNLHGRYAAILLDAPCSSERHVLSSPVHLDQWTSARPRSLSRRQWALLSSCFLLLAPGGVLVYSTCAIAPEENDGVAGRLVAKYGEAAECYPPEFERGEPTEFGRLILPDRDGCGPMYVARFRKAA
jgi:16S rRNA (cytosine1407-C5)-methyltransferase